MKIKYIIALLILSYAIIGIGALAKLQHWSWAGSALIIGMVFQSLIFIIGNIKVLSTKKFKDFLNS